MITIDTGPDRTLVIRFGTGRTLTLPVVGRTGEFLYKIIFDSKRPRFEEKGYCRNFPTQHVIEKWLKEKHESNRQAEKEAFEERLEQLGIKELDFKI